LKPKSLLSNGIAYISKKYLKIGLSSTTTASNSKILSNDQLTRTILTGLLTRLDTIEKDIHQLKVSAENNGNRLNFNFNDLKEKMNGLSALLGRTNVKTDTMHFNFSGELAQLLANFNNMSSDVKIRDENVNKEIASLTSSFNNLSITVFSEIDRLEKN